MTNTKPNLESDPKNEELATDLTSVELATTKRIHPGLVQEIEKLRLGIVIAEAQAETAKARVELAQARYQACIAVMERDHGFRFTADVSIRTDGAVIFNKKG